MKGQRSKQTRAHASLSWSGVISTFIMAAIFLGLHYLYRHGVMTEEQLMLLIFIAVPIAAFLLSGRGQDGSQGETSAEH